MRRKSYQQYAIVQEDSADRLTETLNKILYELRDKDPTVEFEGLTARIRYYEEEETATKRHDREETELKLRCRDCPMFDPVRKKDGTPDNRTSFGFCRIAEGGQALATQRACAELFRMLNEREVKICFK